MKEVYKHMWSDLNETAVDQQLLCGFLDWIQVFKDVT